MSPSITSPTWADVVTAAEAVRPFARRTPLLRAEVDGRPLVLKLEHLQRSGSFKLRGAVNALVSGPLPERCRALNAALAAGEPVDVEIDSVAGSTLGATRVGAAPFQLLQTSHVTSVLVSDAELLAAWLAGRTEGELPCVILCGANSEWTP